VVENRRTRQRPIEVARVEHPDGAERPGERRVEHFLRADRELPGRELRVVVDCPLGGRPVRPPGVPGLVGEERRERDGEHEDRDERRGPRSAWVWHAQTLYCRSVPVQLDVSGPPSVCQRRVSDWNSGIGNRESGIGNRDW
jgi:hypothetical protein